MSELYANKWEICAIVLSVLKSNMKGRGKYEQLQGQNDAYAIIIAKSPAAKVKRTFSPFQ